MSLLLTRQQSSTTTPAVVYFPPGVYRVSSSIVPYYMTQLIGSGSALPTLKALPGFKGLGLIDGDPYYTPNPNWGSTNVFYRQIRNLIIDMTNVSAAADVIGIHWPTAQATSLQNVHFRMASGPASVHVGLFIESGSGGFVADLSFAGGAVGASLGNQQFTMRNLTFDGCATAVQQLWDWGWTYMGLRVRDCPVGINITQGGSAALSVGSLTLLDSAFADVDVAVWSAFQLAGAGSTPKTANSLVLENVHADNVTAIVRTPEGDVLPGGGTDGAPLTVARWGQGHEYVPHGPTRFQGPISGRDRQPSLLAGAGSADPSAYYTRSKPQYEDCAASDFDSVRAAGAKGDGETDDTMALQAAINAAAAAGRILYIDYGLYRVTSTLTVPPGSRIVGEAFPVLLAASAIPAAEDRCGSFSVFANASNPQPLLRVGTETGQAGTVELSDFVLSTQGSQPGAILLEWNLDAVSACGASADAQPAGLWDVHVRIGGFAGTELQVAQCPKTPGERTGYDGQCVAAFMAMHVTRRAAGLYAENVWLWTADHDLDDAANNNTQITVLAGRGLLVEAAAGPVWLVGTASEHFALYQYQLTGAHNVFMGQVQTETPYYQPHPAAPQPFAAQAHYHDPDFDALCGGDPSGRCRMAWGLRVVESSNITVAGAGLYSFFSNYGQACLTADGKCQERVLSLEACGAVRIFNLNTIGVSSMIDVDGHSLALAADNVNVYPETIALFQCE